jgi:signal peptidase I
MTKRILFAILNTLFPGSVSLAVGKKKQMWLLLLVSPLLYFVILRLALVLGIRIFAGTVLSFLIILGFNLFVFRPDPRLVKKKKQIAAAVILGLCSLLLYNMPRLTVGSYNTAGVTMFPALERNQYVGIDKTAYLFKKPARFDIICIDYFERLFVCRIIGLPGEEIKMENNRIFINGEVLPDQYGYFDDNLIATQNAAFIRETKNYPSYKIPKNNYFILGDNRYFSKDSRHFGTVPLSVIWGKAVQ